MESVNINSSSNLIKEELNYTALPTHLKFNRQLNLLFLGDEKGRVSLFDMRLGKAVKLIRNEKIVKDVKYN